MYDNYNYPLGADNPSAPWNEPREPEAKVFEVCISQCISKSAKVLTSAYTPEVEDGNLYCDTSDTEWLEEYYNDGHLDVVQLLESFKEFLQKSLDKDDLTNKERRKREHLISECENWTTDELDITRE